MVGADPIELGAVGGVAVVALAQLVLARRWDGVPLVAWLSVVAAALAPPTAVVSWGGWAAVGLCVAGAVLRRPRWLGRADVLAWAGLLSGGFVAAWSLGMPVAVGLAVGAVGAVGLGAATVDRRRGGWRTRWVGEIPVRERR